MDEALQLEVTGQLYAGITRFGGGRGNLDYDHRFGDDDRVWSQLFSAVNDCVGLVGRFAVNSYSRAVSQHVALLLSLLNRHAQGEVSVPLDFNVLCALRRHLNDPAPVQLIPPSRLSHGPVDELLNSHAWRCVHVHGSRLTQNTYRHNVRE